MFDYKSFALAMKEQSAEVIPSELSKTEADFISTTIYNFAIICGKYLNEEQEYCFTDEQKVFIVQIIAEWTFHKSVDLINGRIPIKYWNAILERIAYTILEVLKQTITKSMSKEEILSVVEYHVIKDYKGCIDKLKLNSEQRETELEQSSIGVMIMKCVKLIKKSLLHILVLFVIGISSATIALMIFPYLPPLLTYQGKRIAFCIGVILISILCYEVERRVGKA